MIKTTHLIKLFLFHCYLCSFGQENFISGYIVKAEGDTVLGYVDYQQWVNSPVEIAFKANINDKPEKFKPEDIKYFYVKAPNELYMGVKTQLSVRPGKSSSQISNENKLVFAFAHVLIIGPMSLYRINYQDSPYYLIETADGSVKELILLRRLVSTDQATFMKDFAAYKNLLKEFENTCNKLKGQSDKTGFNDRDIIRFVTEYNNCTTGRQGQVFRLNKKPITRWGAVLGYAVNQYNFSSQYSYLDNGHIIGGSILAGGFIAAYLPRGRGRWSASFDVLYKPVRMKNETRFYEVFSYYESQNSFYFDLLKISASFRHTSTYGKVRPYFYAGATASLPFRAEARSVYNRVSTNDYRTKVFEGKGELGYLLGGGFKINKAECEFRWERLDYQRTMFINGQTFNFIFKYTLSGKR